MPGDLGLGTEVRVTDQAGARAALTLVTVRIRQVKEEVDDISAGSLDTAARVIEEEKTKRVGDGALSGADIGNLDNLVALTRPVILAAYQDSAMRFVSQLSSLLPSSDYTARMTGIQEDLDEAMHGQFIKGEKSKIAELLDVTNKVKCWNSTIGHYAGKTEDWGKKLNGVKAAKDASEAAKGVKEFSESLGKDIGTVKDVLEIGKSLSTVFAAELTPATAPR